MEWDYKKQRQFDGFYWTHSALTPVTKEAYTLANYWRLHGIRVRVIKTKQSYNLYTR